MSLISRNLITTPPSPTVKPEHFPAKWMPVRVAKMRSKTKPEPRSDSIGAAKAVEAGAYDRLAKLPRLIGLWPSELQDFSAAGTSKILAMLRKALRSERARGRSGHWTYDLNKHLALAESLKAERSHLRELEANAMATQPTAKKAVRAPRAGMILHLPGRRAVVGRSTRTDIDLPDQPVFLLPSLAESNS